MRPATNEYAPFYADYIARVPEEDDLSAIELQSSDTQRLLASLDETHAAFRYAESKWRVKQVIGPVIDAERVFGYRALAISRGETQRLPGFDEKPYTEAAGYDAWKLGDLSEMYAHVRRTTIVFFRNLPAEAWTRRGIASDAEVTVNALAYMIVGHERHHVSVLRERYLL